MSTYNFLIYYLPSSSLKVSPVVSKKISKKAVVRNRIKRRVRAILRELDKKGSFAIVVKKDISKSEYQKLKNELEKNINKFY